MQNHPESTGIVSLSLQTITNHTTCICCGFWQTQLWKIWGLWTQWMTPDFLCLVPVWVPRQLSKQEGSNWTNVGPCCEMSNVRPSYPSLLTSIPFGVWFEHVWASRSVFASQLWFQGPFLGEVQKPQFFSLRRVSGNQSKSSQWSVEGIDKHIKWFQFHLYPDSIDLSTSHLDKRAALFIIILHACVRCISPEPMYIYLYNCIGIHVQRLSELLNYAHIHVYDCIRDCVGLSHMDLDLDVDIWWCICTGHMCKMVWSGCPYMWLALFGSISGFELMDAVVPPQ